MIENSRKCQLVAPGVPLSSLSPTMGSRYSPNLFKWLAKHAKRGQWALYRHDLCDWLILESDGGLLGAKLCGILCNGAREKIWDITTDVETVGEVDEGFWQRYLEVGRCAIDPKHEVWFLDDDARWRVTDDGQKRTCRWCGQHTQYLEHYLEPKTRWRNDWDAKEGDWRKHVVLTLQVGQGSLAVQTLRGVECDKIAGVVLSVAEPGHKAGDTMSDDYQVCGPAVELRLSGGTYESNILGLTVLAETFATLVQELREEAMEVGNVPTNI